MATILDQIVEAKRASLERAMAETPLAELERRIADVPPAVDFASSLRGDDIRLIAEVKKASPSAGLLRAEFDPAWLASTYAASGAAAISCLTDAHFEGTLEHLRQVKDAVAATVVPALRKDFLTHPYQLYEARANGADAALLIVAVLSAAQLREMLDTARDVGLQCLVEVHDEGEMVTAAEAGAAVIGINNRDLRTFKTDLAVTGALASKAPADAVLVSESGIRDRADMERLRDLGAHAALVGEAIVTQPDPGAKIRELLGVQVPAQGARAQEARQP